MATVLLFHHAQGLTDGVHRFAGDLAVAGHSVHVPDLFDGARFATVEEGVAHAEEIGFEEIMARGIEHSRDLPESLVYAGFSLGLLPAQRLAQTRPGALGALLYHDVIPLGAFGDNWPVGVPVQIHVAEHDPWADMEAVQHLHDNVAGSELFIYPGDAHLFADSSLDSYVPDAAQQLMQRTLEFLARVDG